MKMPIIALLVLSLLPIVCSWVSGYCRHKQFGTVDNKNPRKQNAELTGMGERAVAAQGNAWEALAIYAAALLALTAMAVPAHNYADLVLALIIARVLHGVFYIANLDILRSLSFLVSYGICMYLFVIALAA